MKAEATSFCSSGAYTGRRCTGQRSLEVHAIKGSVRIPRKMMMPRPKPEGGRLRKLPRKLNMILLILLRLNRTWQQRLPRTRPRQQRQRRPRQQRPRRPSRRVTVVHQLLLPNQLLKPSSSLSSLRSSRLSRRLSSSSSSSLLLVFVHAAQVVQRVQEPHRLLQCSRLRALWRNGGGDMLQLLGNLVSEGNPFLGVALRP
mmetsp:Transcript_18798/g.34024  ORF Transcript_18798/g.34024 Transcript_18798/m.34024 type:complete len:200 (-) Transcript_18798:341-940(-)